MRGVAEDRFGAPWEATGSILVAPTATLGSFRALYEDRSSLSFASELLDDLVQFLRAVLGPPLLDPRVARVIVSVKSTGIGTARRSLSPDWREALPGAVRSLALAKVKAASYPLDEFVYVLEGDLVTLDNDGTRHEFHPGDALVIPKGRAGIWDMRTRFKKIIVNF